MKRLFYSTIYTAALFTSTIFSSCVKEAVIPESHEEETITLRITANLPEDPQTRLNYYESGKSLKAYWSSCLEEVPLKIHSLSRLAEKTGIYEEMTEDQLDFIDRLEPLNIEARYPSYKERLMKSLSNAYCQQLLADTKELQQWIKDRL